MGLLNNLVDIRTVDKHTITDKQRQYLKKKFELTEVFCVESKDAYTMKETSNNSSQLIQNFDMRWFEGKLFNIDFTLITDEFGIIKSYEQNKHTCNPFSGDGPRVVSLHKYCDIKAVSIPKIIIKSVGERIKISISEEKQVVKMYSEPKYIDIINITRGPIIGIVTVYEQGKEQEKLRLLKSGDAAIMTIKNYHDMLNNQLTSVIEKKIKDGTILKELDLCDKEEILELAYTDKFYIIKDEVDPYRELLTIASRKIQPDIKFEEIDCIPLYMIDTTLFKDRCGMTERKHERIQLKTAQMLKDGSKKPYELIKRILNSSGKLVGYVLAEYSLTGKIKGEYIIEVERAVELASENLLDNAISVTNEDNKKFLKGIKGCNLNYLPSINMNRDSLDFFDYDYTI